MGAGVASPMRSAPVFAAEIRRLLSERRRSDLAIYSLDGHAQTRSEENPRLRCLELSYGHVRAVSGRYWYADA